MQDADRRGPLSPDGLEGAGGEFLADRDITLELAAAKSGVDRDGRHPESRGADRRPKNAWSSCTAPTAPRTLAPGDMEIFADLAMLLRASGRVRTRDPAAPPAGQQRRAGNHGRRSGLHRRQGPGQPGLPGAKTARSCAACWKTARSRPRWSSARTPWSTTGPAAWFRNVEFLGRHGLDRDRDHPLRRRDPARATFLETAGPAATSRAGARVRRGGAAAVASWTAWRSWRHWPSWGSGCGPRSERPDSVHDDRQAGPGRPGAHPVLLEHGKGRLGRPPAPGPVSGCQSRRPLDPAGR